MSGTSWVFGLIGGLALSLAACSSGGSGKDGGIDGGDDEIGPADVNWVVHGTSPGSADVNGLAALPDGSIVMVGNFDSSIEIPHGDPGAIELPATGTASVYVAKLDADGRLAWLHALAEADEIAAYGVGAGADGSFAVTGYFTRTATFGAGQPNETSLTAVDLSDVFIARFDSDGGLLWARSAGSDQEETGLAVAVGDDGSCFLTGRLSFAEVVFGLGEPNETPILSGDYGFLARYQADGSLDWAIESGQGVGLATMDDGGAVVVSREEGWMRHALVRVDAQGAETWRQELSWGSGIVSDVRVTGLAAGGPGDGLLAVGGSLSRSLTFDPGGPGQKTIEPQDSTDLFLAAYSASGQFQWAQLVAGPGFDDEARVAVADDETIMFTAKFVEQIGLGVGSDTETHLSALGQADGLVAAFEPDGGLRWASALMTGDDFEEPTAIAVPGQDRTLVAGHFSGEATIGPGQPRQVVLQSQRFDDVFLFLLGQ